MQVQLGKTGAPDLKNTPRVFGAWCITSAPCACLHVHHHLQFNGLVIQIFIFCSVRNHFRSTLTALQLLCESTCTCNEEMCKAQKKQKTRNWQKYLYDNCQTENSGHRCGVQHICVLWVQPICSIIPFLTRRWTRCGLMFITFFSAGRYSSQVFKRSHGDTMYTLAAKYSTVLWVCLRACVRERRTFYDSDDRNVHSYPRFSYKITKYYWVLLRQHCVSGYTAITIHWLKVSVCQTRFSKPVRRNL